MHDANIYTLLMTIRGFSNEVTVRGLADKLGISYSTLARCKNGVWPRSVTHGAMRGVLEECRERFFDGDGEAMANAILLEFKGQDTNTESLEKELADGGYERFLDALILQASTPRNKVSATPVAEPEPEPVAEPTPAPEPEPSATPEAPTATPPDSAPPQSGFLHDLFIVLPLGIVLFVGIFNVSLASMLTWVTTHRMSFAVILLVIALSPLLTGMFIDAPLAWRAYRRTHPNATFSFQAFATVAKYGDVDGVAPGLGRFNLTFPYALFQPICNVCGAMCVISLLSFLLTLPNFNTFFAQHEWTEFFKACTAVAYFIAYSHAREQIRRPALTEHVPTIVENPDNYLPTRVHVWANSLHLVCVISLTIVLLLSMIAYSVVQFQQLNAPILVLWPYFQTVLFFVFSCASVLAVRIRATSVGTLVPGVLASSVGLSILIVSCYIPSWEMAAICATCALCSVAAIAWHARTKRMSPDWITQGKLSRAYSVAIVSAVAILFVMGCITAAFA